MSNFRNNILDGQELLNQDYEVTFSKYWEEIERFFSPIYIVLMIMALMIFVWITYDSAYFNIDIEVVLSTLLIAGLPTTFIIFIQQFRKFRVRDFNEKVLGGRIWRLLIIGGLLGVFSVLVAAISVFITLFLIYLLFTGSPDSEGIIGLIIYVAISIFVGFQTFYLGYSMLYLIENYRLKKQYV